MYNVVAQHKTKNIDYANALLQKHSVLNVHN